MLAAVFLLTAASAGAAPSAEAAERGKTLAAEVRSQRPARATSTTGTLRLRHSDNRRTTIPVEVFVRLDTNSLAWSTWYRARFPDGRHETLTVNNLIGEPPQFVLRRVTADGRAAELRPQRQDQLYTAFAGTDFWIIDLGMAFLHWPDQRYRGRETRRTRVCHVLESINPDPSPAGYSRVLTWVDDETRGIVRAEAYDASSRLLKEFSPGSFARSGSRYQLRDMEIRNVQTDSRTTLYFDVEDPREIGGVTHLPGAE